MKMVLAMPFTASSPWSFTKLEALRRLGAKKLASERRCGGGRGEAAKLRLLSLFFFWGGGLEKVYLLGVLFFGGGRRWCCFKGCWGGALGLLGVGLGVSGVEGDGID